MSNKRVGVVIMRAQGFHSQHMKHIKRAMTENDMAVIILGSANRPQSLKNPFNLFQRMSMVKANIDADPELRDIPNFVIGGMDHPDDEVWHRRVNRAVLSLSGMYEEEDITCTLYGCEKDSSSFYLKLFPNWQMSLEPLTHKVDATEIRELYFKGQQTVALLRDHPHISDATLKVMQNFKFDPNLQDEYRYYEAEKEKFKDYPYPDTLSFNCGDAVVVSQGKVLMVRRKFAPGRGCLALPGGFKNNNETFHETIIRELREETGITLTDLELSRCFVGDMIFDNPNRSYGVARVTMAGYFDLSYWYDNDIFPEVKAMDDAAEVLWVDIESLSDRIDVFDDHASIVYNMLNIFKGQN